MPLNNHALAVAVFGMNSTHSVDILKIRSYVRYLKLRDRDCCDSCGGSRSCTYMYGDIGEELQKKTII
jgi:hypothetical protein